MAAVVVDEASKEEKSTPADAAAPSPTTPKPSPNPHEEIKAVARKFADNPLQNPDPGVWGVLTAISRNARQRPQGMNILLNGEEHCIGRIVADTRFQIVSINISANHCKIYRKAVACSDDELVSDSCVPVFLKDTSTNGTFVNWKKLRKRSPEARLQHGDIISFVAPPHEEQSYAFVYREVCKAAAGANGANLKRKSEDFCNESKRTKGIGIGAADGPVSLADVRSLQRSNTDLRKQLESHVATIETLRTEIRSSGSRHENEMKELKESISSSYIDQIMELRSTVDIKQKEVNELNTTSAELRSTIKDLNERLSASMQSRDDAHEIIQSQKARISELETQLDEERNQRREERENAAIDLKSALQRVQAEAQEEIKRQAEIYLRQNREQLEVISKLQDSEKESRILVDTLRSKLEDARENIVMSEKKVRQLETQVQEEHLASENNRERAENADSELKRLKKELEVEKVAREEAWAKVSALELEIAAAMHELSIEKQRFQGARERIILRETQLRAFYSTTEEITALFAKQQEQLKAMQKTLEDEENCENISAGFDLNSCPKEINNEGLSKGGDKLAHTNNSDSRTPGLSTSKDARVVAISSSDDTSATEKHNCDVGSQEEENTQDLECTSASKSIKGFGSDIDGVGTAPVHDGEALETEQVPETESPGADIGVDEHASLLQKCSTLAGDTMQLDDETHLEDNMEKSERPGDGNDYCSQTRFEDTEIDTVRTTDLLTSEVPGSWANSTAPSYHGENDSPKNGENDSLRNVDAPHDQSGAAGAAACFADGQAEESQTNVATSALARLSEEHRALNAMIEIVAPDLKDQFRSGHSGENESMSDAETEEGSNDNEGDSESEDGEDSPPSNCGDSPVADEGNDDMIEDSVG